MPSPQARLEILGGCHPALQADILEISGNAMRIEAAAPLLPRAAVKLESGDTLWLAEVCAVEDPPLQPGGDHPGGHRARLRIEHALYLTPLSGWRKWFRTEQPGPL